jgi:hypothetical protein
MQWGQSGSPVSGRIRSRFPSFPWQPTRIRAALDRPRPYPGAPLFRRCRLKQQPCGSCQPRDAKRNRTSIATASGEIEMWLFVPNASTNPMLQPSFIFSHLSKFAFSQRLFLVSCVSEKKWRAGGENNACSPPVKKSCPCLWQKPHAIPALRGTKYGIWVPKGRSLIDYFQSAFSESKDNEMYAVVRLFGQHRHCYLTISRPRGHLLGHGGTESESCQKQPQRALPLTPLSLEPVDKAQRVPTSAKPRVVPCAQLQAQSF